MSTTGSSSDESVHDCDARVPDSDAEGEDALGPATPVFSQHTWVISWFVIVDRNFIGITTWVISWFAIVPVNV